MRRTAAAAVLALGALAFAPDARAQAPQGVHTGTGRTGYEVTFRITDPSAQRMRIKGEWYFSDAADIAAASAPPNAPSNNPNPRLPSQWQVGDFPLAAPNTNAANWPVADMTKDANGVWSLTTPLPSGWF